MSTIKSNWGKGLVLTALVGALALFFLVAAKEGGDANVAESHSGSGLIDVEFKNTEMQAVLRILAAKGKVNIIAGPEVSGTVNIQLNQVTWEKALEVILKTYGLAYEREGNIVRVTTIESLKADSLTTRIFSLSYTEASKMAEALKDILSERGKIKFDERTNLLIVTDVPANLTRIEQALAQIDTITPQVTIESRVIETNLTKDENLGIDWSDLLEFSVSTAERPTTFPYQTDTSGGDYWPTLDPSDSLTPPGSNIPYSSSSDFSFGTISSVNLKAVLNIVQSRTDTKIVANPRVTVLDNQKAKIAIITKYPIAQYQVSTQTGVLSISGFSYEEFGTILEVTPRVNRSGYVTLTVHPEVSRQSGSTTFQDAVLPIIGSQETDTQVMIKDGDTLVIGGLVREDIETTRQKVPILGDIPLIGLIFRNKETNVREQSDLLIFITPHILKIGETVYPKTAVTESKIIPPEEVIKAEVPNDGNKGYLTGQE